MRFGCTRNTRTELLGLAALAASLLTPGQARADFLFSPTGTGLTGAQSAGYFDPSPGNAVAVGGVTAIDNAISNEEHGTSLPTTFQLYYQATVGNVDGPNGQPITSGTYAGLNSAYQITVIASVTETVTFANSFGGGGGFAQFAVSSTQASNSYVQMYETTGTPNNNLTGAGFYTPTPSGTLIYQGSPVANSNGQGNYSTNGTTAPFDSHSNAYPGIQSVVGQGSSVVDFATTYANSNYFVVPPPTVYALEFSTSNITPFKAIDASSNFYGPGGQDIKPNVGATNGLTGPDFQFVSDAYVTPVPEPSSLALVGLGLGGVYALARRRRRGLGG